MLSLHHSFRWVITGVAVAATAAAPAIAQGLIPLTQNRSASVLVNASQCAMPYQSKAEKAPSFGAFTSTLELTESCSLAFALSAADQESSISNVALVGQGGAHDIGASGGFGVIHAISFSYYKVEFELPAASAFELKATLSASAAAGDPNTLPPYARLRLTGPGGQPIIEHLVKPLPGGGLNTVEIQESGALPPATYELLVEVVAAIDTVIPPMFEREASFDFAFGVPKVCFGDIDGDGKTCQSDLGVLLAAYGTCEGDPGYNPAANLAKGPSPNCPGGPVEGIDQSDLGVLLADYGCGGCP